MTIYIVTASNKYFWQTLAVKSHNEFIAERKFKAFLKSHASRDNEKYEWSESKKLCPDNKSILSDSVYLFDKDKIKEADWTDRLHHVGAKVEMINSGGNG